ncbi:MAG TPA: hypothetical protein VES91_06265 [Burkholderiaceae bacterium]|nr:hypothetical protein [Burkholderiaceae bacterium]
MHTFEDSKDSLRFVPFARVDQHDSERSHADIRELAWLKVGTDYEWRVGIRKVFWGVAESQHLVDIVNQTDVVENLDGEEKLGQPMVNLALIRDWGTLDLFVLPYFRERTFVGAEGRLRSQPRVDADQAAYGSAREQKHVDYAARWSKSWSGIDVGLSYFTGTSRDPRFALGVDSVGAFVLVPYYELIHQTGVDIAAPLDAWLLKMEAIHRTGQGPSYYASTTGFEYTLSGIFGTGMDLGILAEYLYDDRRSRSLSPFQDDIMLGLRLALNDEQSSEVLVAIIDDRRSDARFFSLEASRRLGNSWKLSVEARAFAGIPETDPLFSMRRDDYVQLELARHF